MRKIFSLEQISSQNFFSYLNFFHLMLNVISKQSCDTSFQYHNIVKHSSGAETFEVTTLRFVWLQAAVAAVATAAVTTIFSLELHKKLTFWIDAFQKFLKPQTSNHCVIAHQITSSAKCFSDSGLTTIQQSLDKALPLRPVVSVALIVVGTVASGSILLLAWYCNHCYLAIRGIIYFYTWH